MTDMDREERSAFRRLDRAGQAKDERIATLERQLDAANKDRVALEGKQYRMQKALRIIAAKPHARTCRGSHPGADASDCQCHVKIARDAVGGAG